MNLLNDQMEKISELALWRFSFQKVPFEKFKIFMDGVELIEDCDNECQQRIYDKFLMKLQKSGNKKS